MINYLPNMSKTRSWNSIQLQQNLTFRKSKSGLWKWKVIPVYPLRCRIYFMSLFSRKTISKSSFCLQFLHNEYINLFEIRHLHLFPLLNETYNLFWFHFYCCMFCLNADLFYDAPKTCRSNPLQRPKLLSAS